MKKTLVLLITFISVSIFAQKQELGKVTIEELKERRHAKDTSAVAAILFKRGKVKFEYSETKGFYIITEVETKIKIYKKEGYDWANQKIKYYAGDNNESVKITDAVTYNIVGDKIDKTKLKSDGIFDEQINKFWKNKKIAMPNVKEGSIIEYRYLIETPNISSLKDWNFQTTIPVDYSEFKTFIPEYFTYNSDLRGGLSPKKTQDTRSKSFALTYNKNLEHLQDTSRRVSETVEYLENVNSYVIEDIPAIKNEGYVNNINNYISTLSHELSVVKYPNSPPKSYSTNWESVVENIYKNENFGDELNKINYFENDVKTIVEGLNTKQERVIAIFDYVKNYMNWNGFYNYFCHDGVKTAYKNKTGNVAEINLMLTSMLRYAGIEANPVLISTRSNGIAFYPSRTAFDYVISAVEIENSLILLDATDKFTFPNILPLRVLNWNGRLIRRDGSSTEVNLNTNVTSKDTLNLIYTIDSKGMVEGKIRNQFTDYFAFTYRQNNFGINSDTYLEKLSERLNNSEINDYSIQNKNELNKPIVETYSFKNNNSSEVIGDKIYFSPLLFLSQNINPFKNEKRDYPVDFDYKQEIKDNIIINIPEGYQIESIPASSFVTLANDSLIFKFNSSSDSKTIKISSVFTINTNIVNSDIYQELKEFYNEMIKKQTEKVVLRKI